MAEQKKITARSENFPQWYLDVIAAADLAETSIVRGCMIIKPLGFAIWEGVKEYLDRRIKETGHVNAYFPIFIPKSLMSREADHIKGFAKECAVVTHHRLIEAADGLGVVVDPDAKLEEELIVRPTSETIMYESYKNWIQSWRDLPVLINQWNNVVRWEMRTRPFLRTTEFLWQEGHTAHATAEEAEAETLKMLEVYADLCEQILAVPVIRGLKSESEKFAGALRTYCIESLMQDGKALQSGTSHNLGQNFSQAFAIKYTAQDGSINHVWQTSWGLSTRIIGALIMTHSDDKGLVLPPKIAPDQVVVIPIFKDETKQEVLTYAYKVADQLKVNGLRVKLDERDYETPGSKFNEWEKKGTPVRIEVGPKDMANNAAVAVRRDTGNKQVIDLAELGPKVQEILTVMQQDLYNQAQKRMQDNTHEVETYEEFKDLLSTRRGFIRALWCERAECEAQIKAETKATTRCLPLNQGKEEAGKCMHCGQEANHKWLFAIAY